MPTILYGARSGALRQEAFENEPMGHRKITPSDLCEVRVRLAVDQCQRVRSIDLLFYLSRPGDRQQSPSIWTVGRRYTASVSAYYGFNECETQTMPLGVSSFHSLLEHLKADFRSKSRAIIFHNQGCCILDRAKFY